MSAGTSNAAVEEPAEGALIEDNERESNEDIEDASILPPQGSESVTIFTPSPSLLLAGIKSVVCPSLRLRAVRIG